MNAFMGIAPVRNWDLQDWFVAIIIVAAVIGVLYLALDYFGIKIPPILLRIIGIVIVAAFAVLAVRFLFTL